MATRYTARRVAFSTRVSNVLLMCCSCVANQVYSKARCIFDIHNMGYQGPFPNPPFSQGVSNVFFFNMGYQGPFPNPPFSQGVANVLLLCC